MDFFEHQAKAKKQSSLLVFYFFVAVILVILSVYLAIIALVAGLQLYDKGEIVIELWKPEIFLAITCTTTLIVIVGSIYKISSLSIGGGESVAVSLGGKKIPSNTTDLAERVLLNVVEEMALASGVPVPPVFVMDEERGINAFAAGTSPQNAVIGVTRGAISVLNREQLQGVIAHEFSHILNGDMRLNIRLMGWLHGILVLALIGYTMLRLIGRTSSSGSSRSSSSKGKGDGGVVLFLLALAVILIVIGYVGVFFAQIIKAAVSRQREFLADASAVQFTRNPLGIASALKAISGWPGTSRLKAARADEASHMYFSMGIASAWFATHPPMIERIRRIDPSYDGKVERTLAAEHTPTDIIDPQSLSRLRGTSSASGNFQVAHAAAQAGVSALAATPEVVSESVGEPRSQHIEHVHNLLDNFNLKLAEDVRDPLGAVAVVYCLLLQPDVPSVFAVQMEMLRGSVEDVVLQEIRRVLPVVRLLATEQRLPTVCLALPALHQMSMPQFNEFRQAVAKLSNADQQFSFFEYAISRYVNKRIVPRLDNRSEPATVTKNIAQLQTSVSIILSALAHHGKNSSPQVAFDAGLSVLRNANSPLTRNELKSSQWNLTPHDESGWRAFDVALDQLAFAKPLIKRQIIEACGACIAQDGHTTIEEAEMLRVIADALGCPLPPVIAKE